MTAVRAAVLPVLLLPGILTAAAVAPLHGAVGTGVYRFPSGPHVIYLVGHSAYGFAPLYQAWRDGALKVGQLAWYNGYRFRLVRIRGPLPRLSAAWLAALGNPTARTSILRLQFSVDPISSRIVVLDFVRW